jgi:hypothetical protein
VNSQAKGNGSGQVDQHLDSQKLLREQDEEECSKATAELVIKIVPEELQKAEGGIVFFVDGDEDFHFLGSLSLMRVSA